MKCSELLRDKMRRREFVLGPLALYGAAALRGDAIMAVNLGLSAELFHHFKPDREVYLVAADMLGCKPAEVMMVAAHLWDVKGT